MKRKVGAALAGVGCSILIFATVAMVCFWAFAPHVPLKSRPPEEHTAIAMSAWAAYVRAVGAGLLASVSSIYFTIRYIYRRFQA